MFAGSALNQKFREALGLLYRRFNVVQRGEKRCFGVTLSQCMIVEILHQEGRSTVRNLAASLGLDQSTVTRSVDVLVRDGLLKRARDEERDRRRVFVSLSPRGRALARKLEDCADRYCEQILARIPADRREDVLHAIGVVVDALEDCSEVCG
jgi:DNA-binding MarR family transcriptional regulator